MPDFLGADFGADFWQLAAKASGEPWPTPKSFGGDVPGFPAILVFDAEGRTYAGWQAYAQRHEILSRTILWPNSPAGGQLQKLAAARKTSAAETQAAAQRTLLEHLLLDEPDRSHHPLAAALPNAGAAPWQTLVAALSRSRWKTKLFVSDWAAALAALGRTEYQHAHLLSFGMGETRLTSCELEQGCWRVKRRAEFPELSIRLIHEKLAARLAAHAARQLHRDPLLRDRNYIAVRTVIDDCLRALQANPYTRQPVPLFESSYLYELSRGRCRGRCGCRLGRCAEELAASRG